MGLGAGAFSGSGARADNLRRLVDPEKPLAAAADQKADFAIIAAPGQLASTLEMLTAVRCGVFANSMNSLLFRRLRSRLVRLINPDRSELASA